MATNFALLDELLTAANRKIDAVQNGRPAYVPQAGMKLRSVGMYTEIDRAHLKLVRSQEQKSKLAPRSKERVELGQAQMASCFGR